MTAPTPARRFHRPLVPLRSCPEQWRFPTSYSCLPGKTAALQDSARREGCNRTQVREQRAKRASGCPETVQPRPHSRRQPSAQLPSRSARASLTISSFLSIPSPHSVSSCTTEAPGHRGQHKASRKDLLIEGSTWRQVPRWLVLDNNGPIRLGLCS